MDQRQSVADDKCEWGNVYLLFYFLDTTRTAADESEGGWIRDNQTIKRPNDTFLLFGPNKYRHTCNIPYYSFDMWYVSPCPLLSYCYLLPLPSFEHTDTDTGGKNKELCLCSMFYVAHKYGIHESIRSLPACLATCWQQYKEPLPPVAHRHPCSDIIV